MLVIFLHVQEFCVWPVSEIKYFHDQMFRFFYVSATFDLPSAALERVKQTNVYVSLL